jgi:hypothetical protein
LFTTHSRESPLLPGEFVPVRVGAATDLRRQAVIVTRRSEWGARSFTPLVVVHKTLIVALFVDSGVVCVVAWCEDAVLGERSNAEFT